MMERTPRARLRAAAMGAVVALLAGVGCNSTVEGHGGHGGTGGQPGISHFSTSGIDKLDLLLMVDNSRSMADKQQILAAAIPDLVRGVVNPPCVDGSGLPSAQQPSGPTDACPDPATRRKFAPLLDIHIGVITSSIGGHASDACPNTETYSCPGGATNATNNDMGHLISRLDPCNGGSVSTYQGNGFLAWDPAGKDTPPGESQLGSIAVDPATGAVTTVMPGLVASLKDMVLGAGQIGCGYESSMESWYRFLVDPEPYQTIAVDPSTGRADPQGVDQVLLQQRKDFLRPDSLLLIVGMSDENDCSIKEYGQFYFAAQQRDPTNPNKNFYLPKPRSECAVDPNDKCCRSCGQDQSGCPADPNCTGSLDAKTDDVNLRCWDQKRRFGIDFLYPIDRYVTGLSLPVVPNRAGDMVQNPLFSDLNPNDGASFIRDSSLVLLTYVVGVPWQDIARRRADGTPDLLSGLDALGNPVGGFKRGNELAMMDASGHTTWDYVIGNPGSAAGPLDPHMIESDAPRTGTSPITGDTLAPPSASEGGTDAINGHEYTPGTKNGVQAAPDDLEYACIFPLPSPRDCADPSIVSCDCTDPQNDNPLCKSGPNGRTLQTHAKAYPGIRQLALVKALGLQGTVGSICPAQLADPSARDYGYRPAVDAVLGVLGDRLWTEDTGNCLPRKLTADAQGQVACTILEARNTGQHLDAPACDALCGTLAGRTAVPASDASLRTAVEKDPVSVAAGVDCVCAIPQLGGAPSPSCQDVGSPLAACECDPATIPVLDGKQVSGWCYVDASASPPLGNPEILKSCPVTEQRQLRFVGAGAPANGTITFIACNDG
jgi:hypothetical protein